MRLLLALLPLIAFYVVEPRYGLRAAVVAAMVLACVELGWVRWREGRWSRVTLATAALVLGLGGMSLLSDDERFVLVSPAIGDGVLAAILLGARALGRNLLAAAAREQDPDLDLHPLHERFLAGVSVRFALLLLVHAAMVLWAAGESREVWLFVSGPAQYVLLGVQLVFEVAWGRWVVGPRVDAAEAAVSE